MKYEPRRKDKTHYQIKELLKNMDKPFIIIRKERNYGRKVKRCYP